MTRVPADEQRLRERLRISRESLDKIGGGDFTPQDAAHSLLIPAAYDALALLRVREQEAGDADSLFRELAPILGPGKAPSGVSRTAYWLGRVGEALAVREVERDALREIADGQHSERARRIARAALEATS